jgi:peptidoglycan hydrolase-like protein with peptidoglycan-binding domain
MKKYLLSSVVWYALSSLTLASAFTCVDLPKNLSKGMESSSVLLLQNFLKEKGYLTAKPNGYFGVGTLGAVKKYQASVGLSRSGQVFSLTRAAIKNETCDTLSVNTTMFSSMGSKGNSLGVQFIEIGKEYDTVLYLFSIDNKLVYIARKGSKQFFVNDGLAGDLYDNIQIASLKGGLSYFAEDGKDFLVIENGTESKRYTISSFNDFLRTDSANFVILNGKAAYRIQTNTGSFITYNGTDLGNQYNRVDELRVRDNKLAYVATRGKKQLMVFNGIEGKEYDLIKQSGEVYDYLESSDKKLLYVGTNTSSTSTENFIVYGGIETKQKYKTIMEPIEVDGKVAFVVEENGSSFIVYDGQEISKKYTNIIGNPQVSEADAKFAEFAGYYEDDVYGNYLQKLNGQLVFIAQKGKGVVVVNGIIEGKIYDSISNLKIINNKIVYVARNGDKMFVVNYGIEGKKYDVIENNLVDINGKLAYSALNKNSKGEFGVGSRFVIFDDVEVAKAYDVDTGEATEYIKNINGKLAYKVKRGGRSFVFYDGVSLFQEYDGRGEIIEVGGKIALPVKSGEKWFILKEK